MNKAELTELIVNPSKIQKENLPELKILASKYSFSPIFSLLLLSGLSQHDDFSFEEELNTHAYRVPDRIRLFELTHDIKTSIISNEERNDSVEMMEAPQVDEQSEIIEESKNEEKEDAEPYIQEVENKEEAPISIAPLNKTVLDVKDALTSEEKKIEENAKETKVEDNTSNLEDKKELENQSITTENEPVSPLDTDVYASAVSRTIEQEVSKKEVLKEDKFEENDENTLKVENVTTDFYAWLASKQNSRSTKASKTIEINEQKKAPVSENLSPELEPKSKVEHIIESFITNEPQISRPKKEFFSPSKVAKKSLDESSLPVSETLAQIFAAQGNYPKAIASYEQLMLKFPEKKSFFANQIQKLKQNLIK